MPVHSPYACSCIPLPVVGLEAEGWDVWHLLTCVYGHSLTSLHICGLERRDREALPTVPISAGWDTGPWRLLFPCPSACFAFLPLPVVCDVIFYVWVETQLHTCYSSYISVVGRQAIQVCPTHHLCAITHSLPFPLFSFFCLPKTFGLPTFSQHL